MDGVVEVKGGCLCGAVTVSVTGKPVRMAQCHCRDCQKASGTSHVSNAIFADSDVSISGTTSSYSVKADSGNTYVRHFCPTCGSRVFATTSGRLGMTILHMGVFDGSFRRPFCTFAIGRSGT